MRPIWHFITVTAAFITLFGTVGASAAKPSVSNFAGGNEIDVRDPHPLTLEQLNMKYPRTARHCQG